VIGSILLQLIWPLRVYVLVLRTSSGDVDAIMSRGCARILVFGSYRELGLSMGSARYRWRQRKHGHG
jgi:hypothetical protein